MNFKQLEIFRLTVKVGTITKAATLLHMQQPSASRMISELENSLGFSLFIRSKGRLILTQSGQLFYEQVEYHFDTLSTLSHQAQSIRSNMTKSLWVAVAPALSTTLVTDAMEWFHRNNPEYTIHLNTHSSERIMQLMEAGKFDLGFSLTLNTYHDLDMDPIGTLYACCVLPQGHPLSRKTSLSMTDLQGEKIILPDQSYPHSAALREKLVRKNVDCTIVATSMLSSVSGRMVQNGMGISITEPLSFMDYISDRAESPLIIRPLNENVTFSYWAIYNKSLTDGQVIQNLVTHIKTLFNRNFYNFDANASKLL